MTGNSNGHEHPDRHADLDRNSNGNEHADLDANGQLRR
jgi:hypothetical protein